MFFGFYDIFGLCGLLRDLFGNNDEGATLQFVSTAEGSVKRTAAITNKYGYTLKAHLDNGREVLKYENVDQHTFNFYY